MSTLDNKFIPSEEDLQLGEILWDNFQLHQKPKKSDVIICLGSNDMLPAERASDLYLDGWSNYPCIVFTGGGGRFQGDCKTSQARLMADIALKMGVPENDIVLEEKSKNTGENYQFSKEILETSRKIFPKSIISVHMPSAEKRDYGTCKKVWPEVDITIQSPRVPMREYHIRGFQGIPGEEFDQFRVISTLVADYQRCVVYAGRGFMIEQPDLFEPKEVRQAYDELLRRGYTCDMLKDGKGQVIKV